MKNPLLEKVAQIESWFIPNPYMAGDLLDPVFDLVRIQEPEQLVIEIRQFIFVRGRILIPHNEQNAWLTVEGKEHMAGGDLQALRNALWHHSLIKSAQEQLAELFTRLQKPKPTRKKGIRLSRKKRRTH